MDLTTTIRFSNVPNRATLEMVECETRREESIVTIGLMLEDGKYNKINLFSEEEKI